MWQMHAKFFPACIIEFLSLWVFVSDLAVWDSGRSFSFTTSNRTTDSEWLSACRGLGGRSLKWTGYHETALLIYTNRFLCLAVKAPLSFAQTYSWICLHTLCFIYCALQSHYVFLSFPHTSHAFSPWYMCSRLVICSSCLSLHLHFIFSVLYLIIESWSNYVCAVKAPGPLVQAESHLFSSGHLVLLSSGTVSVGVFTASGL